MYKGLEEGHLSWPRTLQKTADITEEQFDYLMSVQEHIYLRICALKVKTEP